MDSIRELVERYYEDTRDSIFNDHSGLDAHEIFVKQARLLRSLKLDRLLFHHSDFKRKKTFELSNAAGFNKDGLIPPQFLNYLGFDRVVVGTATADPWPGNNPIIIQRYPETKSMVNWMGLPGVGADQVGETLDDYGNHGVPITINVMATPGKS
jgi:hypothetical protein